MKYIYSIFFVLLIFISCDNKKETSSLSISGQDLILPGYDSGHDSGEKAESLFEMDAIDIMPEPFIPINTEDENLVYALNINLDRDSIEEQIIAIKMKNDQDSTIRIRIIKLNNILNRYEINWQDSTISTDISSFNIDIFDLTGDGLLEIVVEGIDRDGKSSLDIFKNFSENNYLEYYSIFSASTEGSFKIDEYDRSEAYSAGLDSGETFHIIETRPDSESDNDFDLREITYDWDKIKRSYEIILNKKISGQRIVDARLKELLLKGETELTSFLEGTWLREDNKCLSLIAPNDKTISFYLNDNVQTFIWNKFSHSPTYLIERIKLENSVNDLLQNFKMDININIKSLESIYVFIEDKQVSRSDEKLVDQFTGNYVKLNEIEAEEYVQSLNVPPEEEVPEISGYYKCDEGIEFSFDPPYFKMTNEQGVRNGGFAIYNVGYNVLDLRFFSDARQEIAQEIYKFIFEENIRDEEIIRTLLMQKGKIGIFGFLRNDENTLRFEQIERISAESE